MKTNGARFLESLGIPFEIREYEVDPSNQMILPPSALPEKLACPPSRSSRRC